MHKVIGIFAHVDAGKTTLSEQLLFLGGAVRRPGRVDAGDTALDTDPIERERGITVFSGQAWFDYGGDRYTLIDTPGHVDFAAEAERVMPALDAAVLLADGGDGAGAHLATLYRLTERYRIPVMVLINKIDRPSYDRVKLRKQLADTLTPLMIELARADAVDDLSPALMERIAECDDAFCAQWLEGAFAPQDAWRALGRVFAERAALVVMEAAALSGLGVKEFFEVFHRLSSASVARGQAFDALVYKVRSDKREGRIAFLKLKGGTLHPRDALRFGESVEKVHALRLYRGEDFETLEEAGPGSAVGVTGLSTARCGDRLTLVNGERERVGSLHYQLAPALTSRVRSLDGTPDAKLIEAFTRLADEEPLLATRYDAQLKQLSVDVMGPVQLEVLARLALDRFDLRVALEPPEVLYKETLACATMGYGHYEPLRHYAEVNLRIEPGPRGSGIAFASECHVDDLALSWQRLIQTHVFERVHRGTLIGAPLTDARIVLVAGRAHLKHTEGGDFRQATYRAIRQGLFKAEMLLLEPWYRFEIFAPAQVSGRILSDVTRMAGTFSPPRQTGSGVLISGRAPVATAMNYPVELAALTRGEGGMTVETDGYASCHDPQSVVARVGYDPNADLDQSAASVFCSHGAGYSVNWDEAEKLMHCLKK